MQLRKNSQLPTSPWRAKWTSHLAPKLLQLLLKNWALDCLTLITSGTWIHVSHRAITKNQSSSYGQAHEHLQQLSPTPAPRSGVEGRGKNTHLPIFHWKGSGCILYKLLPRVQLLISTDLGAGWDLTQKEREPMRTYPDFSLCLN